MSIKINKIDRTVPTRSTRPEAPDMQAASSPQTLGPQRRTRADGLRMKDVKRQMDKYCRDDSRRAHKPGYEKIMDLGYNGSK